MQKLFKESKKSIPTFMTSTFVRDGRETMSDSSFEMHSLSCMQQRNHDNVLRHWPGYEDIRAPLPEHDLTGALRFLRHSTANFIEPSRASTCCFSLKFQALQDATQAKGIVISVFQHRAGTSSQMTKSIAISLKQNKCYTTMNEC